jgi:hypothetical protein
MSTEPSLSKRASSSSSRMCASRSFINRTRVTGQHDNRKFGPSLFYGFALPRDALVLTERQQLLWAAAYIKQLSPESIDGAASQFVTESRQPDVSGSDLYRKLATVFSKDVEVR